MPEIDKLFYTVGADTAPFKREIASLGTLTEQQGAKVASTFKTVDAAVKQTHGSTAMATREFRALFDELSSGRTRMTPGTLAIIATRVFGISGAALAAAAAVAAIPAAFAVAAIQVENATARMDKALARTGFAAGATRSDLLNIANQLNANDGVSLRGGVDTLSILASRGNIPRANLYGAAQASDVYRQQTGLSSDKAAEAMEKILSDPAKGGKELFETFKNLNNAQQKQIENYVAVGNTLAAQKVIIDAELESRKNLTKTGGSLGAVFDSVGQKISNWWWGIGGAPQSNQVKMAGLDAQRAELVANPSQANRYPGGYRAMLASIDAQRGSLHYQDRIGAAAADEAEKKTATDELNRQVQSLVDSVDTAHKRTKDYNDAIALITKDLPNLTGKDKAEALRVRSAYGTALKTGQTVEQVLSPTKTKAMDNADYAERHTAEAQAGIVAAYRDSTAAGQRAEYQLEAEIKLHDKAISSTKDYVAAKMSEAQTKKEIAQIQDNRKAADENAMLALEITLLGKDEDLRKRKLADLQVENELKEKGIALTSQEGQEAVRNAERAVELGKTKRDILEDQNAREDLAKTGVGMLGQIFDAANKGGKALAGLLPSLENEILGLVEKLAILNPLENALTGKITGTAGKLPTLASSGLSSGLSSATAWLTKAIGFSQGGAWGAGGVRYAASGMVLGGPTAFHTPSGPVVGGELGKDSEALMPLARGPDGRLGVMSHGNRSGGAVQVTQMINVHPDVSAIARGEIVKAMPALQAAAVKALSAAVGRGFVPGGLSP